MSIGLYSVYRLINPLQHAARSFMPSNSMQSNSVFQTRQKSVSRPLRVSRVVEASANNKGAGRMVISGRMADVCAELDRLVELEQRLQH
jgi:hypothetical protein